MFEGGFFIIVLLKTFEKNHKEQIIMHLRQIFVTRESINNMGSL